MKSISATIAAAILVVGLAGCGGSKAVDTTQVSQLKALANEQATAPKCADLFASGATLPADMPDFCVRDRGDLLYVTAVVCADRRKLYQLEDLYEAWAFEGGTVTTSPNMAADPAFKAAYEECG